jgi:hypothetical protein
MKVTEKGTDSPAREMGPIADGVEYNMRMSLAGSENGQAHRG